MGFSTILKVKNEKEKRVIFPKTGVILGFFPKTSKKSPKTRLESPKTEIGIHFWAFE